MNKIISFILGLIVVIVILLLITGRFKALNFKNLFRASRGNTTITPSPTKVASNTNSANNPTPTSTTVADTQDRPTPKANTKDIKTIPSTGSSTDILAGFIVLLFAGIYLGRIY